MNDERKDEIGKVFLLNKETSLEELEKLEIQEIIFLTTSAKHFKEHNVFVNDNLDEKIKMFSKVLKDKLIEADELYMAYDINTNYPYIDADDKIWVFSKKEYAVNAKEYFSKQLILLEMKKIRNSEIIDSFANLHRLGIKKVLIDNGEYNIVINRNDILPPTDWKDTPKINIPVENPELQHAMIRFFQMVYSKRNSEDREQILHNLEEKMLRRVVNAMYLIPMQFKSEEPSISDEKGNSSIKKGTIMEFASLVNKEDETQVLPVFTDWIELEKVYDRKLWTGSIATYDELLELSEKSAGIVINFKGIPLYINDKNKKRIEEYKIDAMIQQ